jgi:23S rRNA pseudouridine2457 synthase
MKQYYLFNKPYNILSQFTGDDPLTTLASFGFPPDVYAAGRLDKDSEGLLLLTNDGILINKLLSPDSHVEKTYWVQVEGIPDQECLAKLSRGVKIKSGITRPCKVKKIELVEPWPRTPPIRFRKEIPTCWLEIKIKEGKNRQVRRMTASIGYPTLRLIRSQIGPFHLDVLKPGEHKKISAQMVSKLVL